MKKTVPGCLLAAVLLFGSGIVACSDSPSVSTPPAGCARVPPSNTGGTLTVADTAQLISAVAQANRGGSMTILLEDGAYRLAEMLWISGSNIGFRSRSGNRGGVVVRGQGMYGGASHIFNVVGDNFTLADMTIGWVANHAVQIHSDADNPVIHNVRFVDTGEQMLKVSYRPGDSSSSDNGSVEWCLFEYSAGVGPQYYIGGVDAHQAHNWIIRYNTFRHIRSPGGDLAEHAVHFWSGSRNTLVEHNTIADCDRGIGFGLGDRGHIGGLIRNNMVHTSRDVGIGLENAPGAAVYNNTVFSENYPNAIEYRFAGSRDISIINNLTNAAIAARDGAVADLAANVTLAQASWFIDTGNGDLHLAVSEAGVVDQGRALADVTVDMDCDPRPMGNGYDIGADEI